MKAAYVGILTRGATCRMRAESLRKLTPEWSWQWVDTDPPMLQSARPWQTLAFRFNEGRAVDRINDLVLQSIQSEFDLIWVDKAVFLRPETIRSLKRRSKRLVHFTPDTAFRANRSRHFDKTLSMFNLLVTTKSFEVAEYQRRSGRDSVFLATQGYDAHVHYPRDEDELRRKEVVFVGLAERSREETIGALLRRNIPVRLAGHGWGRFLRTWADHPQLVFAGDGLFGDEYASALSSSWIGLGLLSKRFPELHTTRTFEIPACGAVLATERTSETTRFFAESEAIFFASSTELADRLSGFLGEPGLASLRQIASAGRRRVITDGRDYDNILAAILSDIRIRLP